MVRDMPTAECDIPELKQAYQVLGVPVASSALSIKQAYHRLIKRWHPDLYPNGTPAHAEATYMMKQINGAYSRIAHAPLRYHIESYPGAREKRDQRPRVRRVEVEPMKRADQDTLPMTDRLEFWVRFAFGAILGAFISLRLFLVYFEHPRFSAVITVVLTIACGLTATRWGDELWHKVQAWWWFWW
jgi:curved DNA-binding protein CbpA